MRLHVMGKTNRERPEVLGAPLAALAALVVSLALAFNPATLWAQETGVEATEEVVLEE